MPHGLNFGVGVEVTKEEMGAGTGHVEEEDAFWGTGHDGERARGVQCAHVWVGDMCGYCRDAGSIVLVHMCCALSLAGGNGIILATVCGLCKSP